MTDKVIFDEKGWLLPCELKVGAKNRLAYRLKDTLVKPRKWHRELCRKCLRDSGGECGMAVRNRQPVRVRVTVRQEELDSWQGRNTRYGIKKGLLLLSRL